MEILGLKSPQNLLDCLRKKVNNGNIKECVTRTAGFDILDRDLYRSEPWNVFTNNDPWDVNYNTEQRGFIERKIYIYVKLIRITDGKRFSRKAGGGRWDHSRGNIPVEGVEGDQKGAILGFKWSFNYKVKNNMHMGDSYGEWRMNEFKLGGNDFEGLEEDHLAKNLVLCQITQKIDTISPCYLQPMVENDGGDGGVPGGESPSPAMNEAEENGCSMNEDEVNDFADQLDLYLQDNTEYSNKKLRMVENDGGDGGVPGGESSSSPAMNEAENNGSSMNGDEVEDFADQLEIYLQDNSENSNKETGDGGKRRGRRSCSQWGSPSPVMNEAEEKKFADQLEIYLQDNSENSNKELLMVENDGGDGVVQGEESPSDPVMNEAEENGSLVNEAEDKDFVDPLEMDLLEITK